MDRVASPSVSQRLNNEPLEKVDNMRISELIEHLSFLEAAFGDVFVEGNRQLILGPEDFSYLDRDGNEARTPERPIAAVRICQESD
jgi:hypothetical protein